LGSVAGVALCVTAKNGNGWQEVTLELFDHPVEAFFDLLFTQIIQANLPSLCEFLAWFGFVDCT
jgi:hypothetical protein